MRRASIRLAVLALAALGGVAAVGPAVASAAPTVTFKVKPLPIPHVRHTGYHLGWGVALRSEYKIRGTEYGGFPAPLIGVNYYLPKGSILHPQGFPTCPVTALEQIGHCASKTKAGPAGSAEGVVAFGNTRVPEKVSVQPYFAPGGGLEFLTKGTSPVALEFISKGHWTGASGLFSKELISEVPLVETVQGAPDASTEEINVLVGAAYKKHKKWTYYGRVPKRCPKGGFTVKSELIFANTAALPARVPGEIVTNTFKQPCPRGSSHKKKHH